MEIVKKVFLVLFLLYISSQNLASAHEGGHYHGDDYLNSWRLKNGEIIEGNFSFSKNGMLFLEQREGILIGINIQDLSEQDQKLANFKIEKELELNIPKPIQQPTVSSNDKPYKVWFLYFLTALLILGITYQLHKKIKLQPVFKLAFLIGICTVAFAFKNEILPKTKISLLEEAFKPYQNTVKTSFDNDNFYIASHGIPEHNMMVGITAWQQQIPVPQNYTGDNQWSIPLQPVYAKEILSTKNNFMRGAIALAVNGVPIFNPLNNRGEDSYLIGELDQWGGHCGKADDYHYHVAPLSLQSTSGLKPIAFALDGFAIYGDKESDGSKMKPLDSFHGHEDGLGSYHYHGTKDYPYTIAAMRGVVKTDGVSGTENQIMPQPSASPLRPALRQLRGAKITGYKTTGENSRQLIYEINGQSAFINYKWDNQNNYTVEQISPSGEKTVNNYVQRTKNKNR